MNTKNLFLSIIFLLIVQNVSFAQFQLFLPSENDKVTGEYYDDWITTDIAQYAGTYKYFKDEWETKNYEADVFITYNDENISSEWNQNYDNEGVKISKGIMKISNGEFTDNSQLEYPITGTFRKLTYTDKNGNTKVSYQFRRNGDCCDGACDDYFERIEIK